MATQATVEQQDSVLEIKKDIAEVGSPCKTCGDRCPGFSLHRWRKICSECHCPREEHGTSSETEETSEPGDSSYLWLPRNCSLDVAKAYFDSLPPDKVPISGTEGEVYRQKQLIHQLPIYDFDIFYSIHNERNEDEKKSFELFVQERKETSRGRGEIKLRTAADVSSPWVCCNCQSTIEVGELAVFAEKAGPDRCWHASCFICTKCNEILVDLIYFCNVEDGKLYCGRHHAEQFNPRCAGCDELILCKEYTFAENRNWHKDHFCCLKCDKQLAEKRFIIKDQYPVCLSCRGIVTVCETCGEQVSEDDPCIISKENRVWHAASDCCFCIICKCPLNDKPYLTKNNRLLCSKEHFGLYKDNTELMDSPAKVTGFVRRTTLKHGYTIAAYNSLCVVFIPESSAKLNMKVRIHNVSDPDMYPAIGSELIRLTPIVELTSTSLTNEQPIIIELMKTVQLSDLWQAKFLNIIPATCKLNDKTKWNHFPNGVQCEVLSDRVVINYKVTHPGLITAFAQFSHPSASISLTPKKSTPETTELTIHELPGFKLQFPSTTAVQSNDIVEVKATAYYNDPLSKLRKGDNATIASPCVSLEPHGLKFSQKIPISLPIADWEVINNEYPDAKLQLWHNSGTADSIHGWEIIKGDAIEVKKYNGTGYVAKVFISHFSCHMLRWNQSLESCGGDISRSFLKQVDRVKTHCQVQLMTQDRKLSLDSSKKGTNLQLVATVYQFGKMYSKQVKYSNILYDSGDEPVELNVGTLEFEANLFPLFPSSRSKAEQSTQTKKTTLMLRENSDCQAEFTFKLPYILDLHDSLDLGQLTISLGDTTDTSNKNIFKLKKSLAVDEVYDVLQREHYRWRIIGKAFGIQPEVLTKIGEKNLGYTDKCLQEVIKEWIKHRNSSWLALASALQQENVPTDLYDVAEHIMDVKVRSKVPTVSQQLPVVVPVKKNEDTDDYKSAVITQQSVYFTEAEKKADVPFLYHHIVECDWNGIEFTIKEHDITLRIPKGAVPTGKKIRFEIGVAMYGPFRFPGDTRPISPIVWLCNLDKDSKLLKLKKPFQLIVPHILTGLTKQKLLEFEIEFGKALHSRTIIDGDQKLMQYQFNRCDTKPLFASDQQKSYGLLKSTHCCFYCLLANQTVDVTRNITYCLVRIERQIQLSPNKSEVCFAGIYFLKTCMDALKEQFPQEEGYKIVRYVDFKFESENPKEQHIKVSIAHEEYRDQCVIALDPNPAEIRATDIDFWDMDFNTMRLRHETRIYPPSVIMTVTMKPPEQIFSLLVGLNGSSSSHRLKMDITFPLGYPGASTSSLGSSGSDYQLDSGAIHPKDDVLEQKTAFRELYPLRALWDSIGALLGIKDSDIETIKIDESTSASRLRCIISQWLKQGDSSVPTWRDLLDAVSTLDADPTIIDKIKSHIAS